MSDPRAGRGACPLRHRTGHVAVVLPADPASPARARQVLRRVLTDADRLDCLDAAELACTELVTNAVLHAHTPIEVTVDVVDAVRVSVHDGNASLPRHPHYDAHATTGRGLALVAAVTDAYGVTDVGPAGKTVWFTVGGPARERAADDLLRAWAAADWDLPGAVHTAVPDAVPPPVVDGVMDGAPDGVRATDPDPVPDERVEVPDGGPDGTVGGTEADAGPDHPVRLVGLPVMLWLAAAEHHDALLRELVLHAARRPDLRLDLVGADRARSVLSAAVSSAVSRPRPDPTTGALDLREDPAGSVDLALPLTAGTAGHFTALQDALDTAEALARAGDLLARPGLPEVVAVRDWACEQVVAQLAGITPAGWPGIDHGALRDDAVDPGHPGTHATGAADPGLDRVIRSDRAVVAADDSNRIVAVSAPMAHVLGWTPGDLVGRRVVVLVPVRLREAHVAGFTRHQTTGQSRILGVPLTLPVLRADDTEVECRVLIESVEHASGRPLYLAWFEPTAEGTAT